MFLCILGNLIEFSTISSILYYQYKQYKKLTTACSDTPIFLINSAKFKNGLSQYLFIVCSFGYKIIKNAGKIKNFLVSIEMSIPNATIILAISTYTQVDPLLLNLNLNIHIERYLNETKSFLQEKYKFNYTDIYYFSGIRYKFYQEYLESHPEVEYAMFCDDDTLILKDPFELLKKK